MTKPGNNVKCECQERGVLQGPWASMYDTVKELPYVNHAPGECKCRNELKLRIRDGKAVWLCSNCHRGEEEIS